jgi:hypothetical protein
VTFRTQPVSFVAELLSLQPRQKTITGIGTLLINSLWEAFGFRQPFYLALSQAERELARSPLPDDPAGSREALARSAWFHDHTRWLVTEDQSDRPFENFVDFLTPEES